MSASTVRALVVEDDPSWQQILGEILADMGLAVDLARGYEEAIAAIRAQPHRIAVLDLSLGGPDHNNQDGLRVAEAVNRADPGCRILFLTGFATVEFAVQVIKEHGAFTCLRKEVFRRADFRKLVSEAMALPPVAQIEIISRDENRPPNNGKEAPIVQAPEPAKSTALVVEDDAGWRGLIVELLGEAGYDVRACGSYVEAIGLIKRERSALAVVDLSLASSLDSDNLDGFRLLASLHKAGVPAVVVSGYAEPSRIEKAYQDGLMVSCIEKQSFDRAAFLKTVQNARTISPDEALLSTLTDREREVLALLARGLTNKEIAVLLVITPNTVKRHLKSLFTKLDVSTRSAASAKAINMRLGDS